MHTPLVTIVLQNGNIQGNCRGRKSITSISDLNINYPFHVEFISASPCLFVAKPGCCRHLRNMPEAVCKAEVKSVKSTLPILISVIRGIFYKYSVTASCENRKVSNPEKLVLGY